MGKRPPSSKGGRGKDLKEGRERGELEKKRRVRGEEPAGKKGNGDRGGRDNAARNFRKKKSIERRTG